MKRTGQLWQKLPAAHTAATAARTPLPLPSDTRWPYRKSSQSNAISDDLAAARATPAYSPLNGRTTNINRGIRRAADSGYLAKALQLAGVLKTGDGDVAGSKPDSSTYEALAAAFAYHGLHVQALQCLDDAKDVGVVLDTAVYNEVLRAHIRADVSPSGILAKIEEAGLQWNRVTVAHMLDYCTQKRNLELALQILSSAASTGAPMPTVASESKYEPQADLAVDDSTIGLDQHKTHSNSRSQLLSPSSHFSVMALAAERGETVIASDLLTAWLSTYPTPEKALKTIPPRLLAQLLSACAGNDDIESAISVLQHLRSLDAAVLQESCTGGALSKEDVIISLANFFAHHGHVEETEWLVLVVLPQLLNDGLAQAQESLSILKEWHIAPLVSVYTSTGDFDKAINTFSEFVMKFTGDDARSAMVEAQPSHHIFYDAMMTDAACSKSAAAFISSRLEKHNEMVSQTAGPDNQPNATSASLSNPGSMNSASRTNFPLPTQFVNATVKACHYHGYSEEAEGIATEMLRPDGHFRPNIETFHILLAACAPQRSQSAPHGEGEEPDQPYRPGHPKLSEVERIQTVLQRDFPHLIPVKATYELLIDLYTQAPLDDSRWQTAFEYLEEMKHFNMLPSPHTYAALMRRLLAADDDRESRLGDIESLAGMPEDPRIQLLLQEMATLGYLGGGKAGQRARSALNSTTRDRLGRDRLRDVMQTSFASSDRSAHRNSSGPQQRYNAR